MLSTARIVAFVPTLGLAKVRTYCERILGLRAVSQDRFAVVFEAN